MQSRSAGRGGGLEAPAGAARVCPMHRLARTVRFSINPPAHPAQGAEGGGDSFGNAFAGAPSMRGLGRQYELEIECAGKPDERTGYLVDIKDVDAMVRARLMPIIARACEQTPWIEPIMLVPALWRAAAGSLCAPIERLRWRLTPTYAVEMSAHEQSRVSGGVARGARVALRQQFDFAAAHRLHAPGLSDAENRALFGKCNNPAGHGHNYRLEPLVVVELAPDGPAPFTLADLERLTSRTVIERLDHKHLNLDTPEFSPERGHIPSVERIAQVAYELLAPQVAQASQGRAELQSVTVWETDRTSSTYPA